MGKALTRGARLLALMLVGLPAPLDAQESVLVPLHSVVDVSTLPPPSPVAPSASTVTRMKPFLTPDPEGLRQWRELLEQAPGALPLAPEIIQDAGPRTAGPRVVATAPAVATQFEGLTDADNSAIRGFTTLPPDDNLGVGLSHVFQMVNSVGRITDKSGAAASFFSLNTFFAVDAGFDEADPRVIYDAASGRWFAVYLEFSTLQSSLLLAVSASSDPTGSFCLYHVGDPANSFFETFLQDFPMIGVSDDKVVLSYNGFASPTSNIFIGAGIYVLNKAELTGASCALVVHVTRVAPDSSLFTPHPAQSLTPTSDLYLAMHSGSSGTLTLLTISGVPTSSTDATVASTALSINSWAAPPLARQAGSSVQLDTGDERVLSVAWQSGSLWVAGNEACMPSGDSMARSCLRVIELLTAGPTVHQDITFGAAGEYYYYPALRPTVAGDVLAVFTRSSASAFASVRITGRLATDPLDTLQPSSELRSGGGPQTDSSGRMGDYSGAALDPNDTSKVWVIGEYIQSSGNANWGTFVAQLYFGPAPSTLTVDKSGTGRGTVTSQPTGITCGATCSATYANGTFVTLTAMPAASSAFAGWSGGGCSGTGTCAVTLATDTTVTATFTLLPTFTLTVTAAGTGDGTVTITPAGISCPPTCAASFTSGTTVTLFAAPGAGSGFGGWSDGGCSGTGVCTVSMSAAVAVTATFVLHPPLALSLNQPTFHAGDTLRVNVTVANPGPTALIDVYFGALLPPAAGPGVGCPGGDAVAFAADDFTRVVVTCLSAPPQGFAPLFRSRMLPGSLPPTTLVDFFSFVWAPDLPAGPYTTFMVLTPPDAFADGSVDSTDFLAAALQGLTFAP